MAITSQPGTSNPDWTTADGRTITPWTDIWSPTIVSRVAGILALALLLATPFLGTDAQFHSDMSAQRTLTWVSHSQPAVWLDGFTSGLVSTLYALLIVLLVALTLRTGILARIAYIGAAASMASGWTKAGVEYALADLAHRGRADAGVLALFSLARTMDYTDGFALGLALGCVGLLLMCSRTLPRLVVWLGLLVALGQIVLMPIQLVMTGTGNGAQGPISVVSWLVWLLVVGIVLLTKPVRLVSTFDAN